MAETALCGAALMEDVRQAPVQPGRGHFWWLGQHSFIVKLAGKVLYIDPYLSPSPARQTPPLFQPE